ncbi:hypothetical protein LEMLEM_LOCUS8939, partial [Lemmus lemmus]
LVTKLLHIQTVSVEKRRSWESLTTNCLLTFGGLAGWDRISEKVLGGCSKENIQSEKILLRAVHLAPGW